MNNPKQIRADIYQLIEDKVGFVSNEVRKKLKKLLMQLETPNGKTSKIEYKYIEKPIYKPSKELIKKILENNN